MWLCGNRDQRRLLTAIVTTHTIDHCRGEEKSQISQLGGYHVCPVFTHMKNVRTLSVLVEGQVTATPPPILTLLLHPIHSSCSPRLPKDSNTDTNIRTGGIHKYLISLFGTDQGDILGRVHASDITLRRQARREGCLDNRHRLGQSEQR